MTFRESDTELAHSCEWCGDSPRSLYAVVSNMIERWKYAKRTNNGQMTAELADHLGRLERCIAHVQKGVDAHFDALDPSPETAKRRALVREGREAAFEAEVARAHAKAVVPQATTTTITGKYQLGQVVSFRDWHNGAQHAGAIRRWLPKTTPSGKDLYEVFVLGIGAFHVAESEIDNVVEQ